MIDYFNYPLSMSYSKELYYLSYFHIFFIKENLKISFQNCITTLNPRQFHFLMSDDPHPSLFLDYGLQGCPNLRTNPSSTDLYHFFQSTVKNIFMDESFLTRFGYSPPPPIGLSRLAVCRVPSGLFRLLPPVPSASEISEFF